MSNKIGTLSLSLSYVGPLGQAQNLTPPVAVQMQYQGLAGGSFDVPDGTNTDTVYTITMADAGIDKATGLVITNNTKNGENPGVELKIEFNGGGGHHVTPGATVLVMMPTAPCVCPIGEVVITTKHASQVGPGSVGYLVFGDPTT